MKAWPVLGQALDRESIALPNPPTGEGRERLWPQAQSKEGASGWGTSLAQSPAAPRIQEWTADVEQHISVTKAVVPPTQRLDEGQYVWLRFEPTCIHFFDVQSEDRVYSSKPAEELECPLPDTE